MLLCSIYLKFELNNISWLNYPQHHGDDFKKTHVYTSFCRKRLAIKRKTFFLVYYFHYFPDEITGCAGS